MVWKIDGPQGNESAKIKYHIVPYTRGKVLDLGCGPWKAYPHFISVDNYQEWPGLRWKPDIIGDAARLDIIASNSMDAVFSSHLLEHIEDHIKALQEWWRVVKVGGHLVLYLPHKNFYPNIGEEGANPDHKHDFLPKDIISVFKSNPWDWDLVESDVRSGGDEYSFFQVYKKLPRGGGQQYSYAKPRPPKSCAVVRYGGFGDMIQATAILPKLRKDGFHVTVLTTPRGHDIIKNDPNVDEFVIQDDNQVPAAVLHEYWAAIAPEYDRFINLSESVEGTFLAIPGRANHAWPKPLRYKFLNHNYIEFAHMLAGVDAESPGAPKFYPTDREKRWAKKERSKISGRAAMWCLSGSSLHKAWPYVDAVIAEYMLCTEDINFVLVGDIACKLLERGWEKEPRVHLKSGEWSIRETLTFAEECDIVIGPETGVLNSVSGLDIPKIVFLSHSSEENLTKHWVNCIALKPEPDECPCYPCHKLHTGFEHCNVHSETGAALCQAVIEPPVVAQAMVDLLGIKSKQRAA